MTKFVIHVQQIHVAQMLFVQKEMELVHANACQNTLAIRTVAVAPNVLQIVTVQAISLVSITNVKIHAPGFVRQMPCVALLIMRHNVIVWLALLAIRPPDATKKNTFHPVRNHLALAFPLEIANFSLIFVIHSRLFGCKKYSSIIQLTFNGMDLFTRNIKENSEHFQV